MKNKLMISLRGNRNQREIAEALNISLAMYNLVENGKRFPGKELLENICKFYGVTVEELFFSNQVHLE